MISVEEAKEFVLMSSKTIMKSIEVDLLNANGFVVAEDIKSSINMPPFRQSAMDGYAVCIGDSKVYTIIDEVKAGNSNNPILKTGEAVRIFTGAPVPDTANAVVMQENVKVEEKQIFIENLFDKNINIKPIGEQVTIGDVVLEKGTKLKSVHIGFLSGLGITKVRIYKKPTVAIVVTGSELIIPGEKLSYGKIYESNGIMLTTVLHQLGFMNTTLFTIKDNYEDTKYSIEKAIKEHDIVVVTGGISVGDYDFVGKALQAIEVKEVFYKVRQKPGKPLFFGLKEETSIVALPGNPGAALSCFYNYVYPILNKIQGNLEPELPHIYLSVLSDYKVKGNRGHFLKAKIHPHGVEILEGQSSAMLRVFSVADALVYLPENVTEVYKDQKIKTIILPI